MEHALTRTAAENDPDFLVRVARSWTDALDQDGAEPSEELLRQLQGAFIRQPRHGLHHLEIFATAEQFEHLLTVMNTATNPRTQPRTPRRRRTRRSGQPAADSATPGTAPPRRIRRRHATADAAAPSELRRGSAAVTGPRVSLRPPTFRPARKLPLLPWSCGCVGRTVTRAPVGTPGWKLDPATRAPGVGLPALDLRSRPQKLLDGLVGACKVALAAGTLPAAGGLRPQVMATIDYRDLLTRLGTPPTPTPADQPPATAGRPGTGARTTGAHRDAAVHRARHRLHRPEDRLRRRHHPGPARRRGPDPGHRPGLPDLPAPHPQSPHRPGPGLRLPRLHHPRHPGARPTTSPTGPAAEPPAPRTEPCSAPTTTT